MNRFSCFVLTVACMALLNTASALPFIHTSGIMGDLFLDAPETEKQDTVPGSLDAHLRSIHQAEKQLSGELAQKNWIKIEQSLQAALSKLNSGNIEREISQALNSLQSSKIQLAEQLKSVDFSKEELAIQLKALESAMDNLKLDQKKISDDLKAQKEHIREQLKTTLPNMEAELKKAKTELNKARKELTGYKQMIDEMQRDGLVDDAQNYRIEFNEKELIINNKKQSDAVYKKYKSYFSKKSIIIQNKNGRFDINSNQDE